jgi:hypothetical protein
MQRLLNYFSLCSPKHTHIHTRHRQMQAMPLQAFALNLELTLANPLLAPGDTRNTSVRLGLSF